MKRGRKEECVALLYGTLELLPTVSIPLGAIHP